MEYQNEGVNQKNWGYELVWASNKYYCGKIIFFEKSGNKTEMILHKEKIKSWFINSGKFRLNFIDVSNGTHNSRELSEGDTITITNITPHQLEALVDNSSITEVSTNSTTDDIFYLSTHQA